MRKDVMSESQAGATCPVKNIEMNTPDSPALTHFRLLDECQDGARPVFRNTEADVNYWVFTDNSVILYGLPFRLEELYRDAKILEIFGAQTKCCGG
jgi:hypothetical protein